MAIYDSILDTIGRTPVVRLHRVAPAHVDLYVKVEAFNPAGSVKDPCQRSDRARRRGQGPAQARRHHRRGDLGQHRRGTGRGGRRARLQVRRGHDRDLLGRAAQADPRLWRQGDPDPGRRARQRHGPQGRGTGEEARLVPGQPVRQSGQPGLPPPDHRRRDPARLRRPPPRPFRQRLGHRRHHHRRGRSAARGPSGSEDHRRRTGQRLAAGRQRVEAAQGGAGPRTSCRRCSTARSPTRS